MDEKVFNDRIRTILTDYLAKATPAERHVYAFFSNYDGNSEGISYLLSLPQLDRATALLIYWQLGAAWFVQYANESEIEGQSLKEDFQTLCLIETRYAEGFYANHDISFDPWASTGGRPDDYPDILVKRPIPKIMLTACSGKVNPLKSKAFSNYDDGLPPDVNAKIEAACDEMFGDPPHKMFP